MKRILVVDDDVDICMLLSSFLGKKGFEVSKAHSSKGMMNLMNEKKFDAVLSLFHVYLTHILLATTLCGWLGWDCPSIALRQGMCNQSMYTTTQLRTLAN